MTPLYEVPMYEANLPHILDKCFVQCKGFLMYQTSGVPGPTVIILACLTFYFFVQKVLCLFKLKRHLAIDRLRPLSGLCSSFTLIWVGFEPSTRVVSCCVYEKWKRIRLHTHGITPYMFDYWADPAVVHLLQLHVQSDCIKISLA